MAGFALGDAVCGWWPAAAMPSCAWCRWPSACRCRGLSDVEAASLPETFFTVWSNVFDRGRLQAGETLLVQGGSSGIGVTAIQLAKAWGPRSSSRRQRREVRACLALGADHAINYKRRTSPRRQAPGGAADVILDMVAATTWRARCPAWPTMVAS
jgi:NADPH2:quinone reductase